MWLLLTGLAAIVSTVIWYVHAPKDTYKVGLLSLGLWGATLMWLVDHIMAFLSEGGEFFELGRESTMLGVSVILFALILWLMILLISDPKGVLKRLAGR